MVLKHTIEVWHEYHEGTRVYEELAQEKERAISRIMELLLLPTKDKDTRRLRKRIIKHNQELFIFLDNPLVEPTNNRAERQLRPCVIMRKLTLGPSIEGLSFRGRRPGSADDYNSDGRLE